MSHIAGASQPRPPGGVSFEVIQRCRARHFGGNNIQCLHESVRAAEASVRSAAAG